MESLETEIQVLSSLLEEKLATREAIALEGFVKELQDILYEPSMAEVTQPSIREAGYSVQLTDEGIQAVKEELIKLIGR